MKDQVQLQMSVRSLTADDTEAYAEFRLRMWPIHPAAGAWEVVRLKYMGNPLAASSPGSGLYAYFQGNDILGIMGAFPMPITLNGSIYAGHMLADWAILPQHQYSPTFSHLWNTCLSLPGRKFSAPGSRASTRILENRGVQIPMNEAVAILRPVDALSLRSLRLVSYAHPSPLSFEHADLPRGVQFQLAESFDAPLPYHPADTAFVRRDRDYWKVFCSARLFNGAIPLRMTTAVGEANLVLRLLETGRFRYATLMALQLVPATIENSRKTGLLLRATLDRLRVAVIGIVDVDALTRELLHSLSRVVFRNASWWYGIRRPSDTFQIEDVRWWITNAEKDAYWVVDQPTSATGRSLLSTLLPYVKSALAKKSRAQR